MARVSKAKLAEEAAAKGETLPIVMSKEDPTISEDEIAAKRAESLNQLTRAECAEVIRRQRAHDESQSPTQPAKTKK